MRCTRPRHCKNHPKRIGLYLLAFIFLFDILGFLYFLNEPPKGKIISPVSAQVAQEEALTTITPTPVPLTKEEKLESYLESKGSPLSIHASHILDMADKYDVSYTLIVAISGKESGFGKNIKKGSYNAWGIMAWDNTGKRYIRDFSSWQDGISYIAKLLSTRYREKMNSAIQESYCPSYECSDTWVSTVTGFQEEINSL